MENGSLDDILQRVHYLQTRLNRLSSEVEHQQEMHNHQYEALKNELRRALDEVHILVNYFAKEDRAGLIPSYEIPIQDRKLRSAWQALFRYPDGATAETIAKDLDRHRSTVSTYLNMLETLGFARKSRRGHQIVYKATIKSVKDETNE